MRNPVTPFRVSQVRLALEGVLRAVAPHLMAHRGYRLRDVVRELAADDGFWKSINQPSADTLSVHGTATTSTSSVMTKPIASRGGEKPESD